MVKGESYYDYQKQVYYCDLLVIILLVISIGLSLLSIKFSIFHNSLSMLEFFQLITSFGVIATTVFTFFKFKEDRDSKIAPNVYPTIINHDVKGEHKLEFRVTNNGPGIAYDISIEKDDNDNFTEESKYIMGIINDIIYIKEPIGCLPRDNYLGDDIAILKGDKWYFNGRPFSKEELIKIKINFKIKCKDSRRFSRGYPISLTMGSYLHKDQYNPMPDIAISTSPQTADDAPQSD